MPVRRRVDRRRAAELPAWRGYFECGFDYFQELPEIGVSVDAYGRPERSVAEAAWRSLGEAFLASRTDDELKSGEPFALREFGLPGGRRR